MSPVNTLRNKPFRVWLSAILLGFMFWQWGQASWIYIKATLAQHLIQQAWQKTLIEPNRIHKPWPWADTWPVARLQVPHLNQDLYVLSGIQGNALAFGPGYQNVSANREALNPLSSTPAPSNEATLLIGGHRDTHFRFLQHLQAGDAVHLQDSQSRWHHYEVEGANVVDSRQPYFAPAQPQLLLVTCYPFSALTSGPQRYVVSATPWPLLKVTNANKSISL